MPDTVLALQACLMQRQEVLHVAEPRVVRQIEPDRLFTEWSFPSILRLQNSRNRRSSGKSGGTSSFCQMKALQQVGMIGKVVDDLRGRQPTFAKLWLQDAHVVLSAVRPSMTTSMGGIGSLCNKKTSGCSVLAADHRGCCHRDQALPLKRSREG